MPLYEETIPFIRRVVRYGSVGFMISLFYSITVIVSLRAVPGLSPVTASIAAFVVTLPLAYLAHGRVSFPDRTTDSLEALRFVVSTAISFVLAVGGMYVITEIAGRSFLLGIAWNWMIIPAMNFLGYMLWVFKRPRNTTRIE